MAKRATKPRGKPARRKPTRAKARRRTPAPRPRRSKRDVVDYDAPARRRTKSGRKILRRSFSFGWRLFKGTAKGSARRVRKYVPLAATAITTKVIDIKNGQQFEPGYEHEPDEVPERRWTLRRTYTCCGRRFHTVEGVNRHQVEQHDDAHAERAARPRPKLIVSKTAKTRNQRTVVPPPGVPGGRHRAKTTDPNATRVEALLAAHRDKLDKIGKKEAMSDSSSAHMLIKGFRELAEGPLGGMSRITATAMGLERALAAGSESLHDYRMKLIQAGFDPGHLQNLARMEELAEQMSRLASGYIATVLDEMAADIAAAKARLAGARPSDDILAS